MNRAKVWQMGQYLNKATGNVDAAETSGLWKRIATLLSRRRLAGIGHLNERMLRDIGLGVSQQSEFRKIERLRRP